MVCWRVAAVLAMEPQCHRRRRCRHRCRDPTDKPLYVHRQSAYLFGRERLVADIPLDHPSCSGQHAVLQYRQVAVPADEDGATTKLVVR